MCHRKCHRECFRTEPECFCIFRMTTCGKDIKKPLNIHLEAFLSVYTIDCVRMIGLEPTRLTAPDPKSGAATNYATSACVAFLFSGAKIGRFSDLANNLVIKLFA